MLSSLQWPLRYYSFVSPRPAAFLAGFLAVEVFFLGDRLAVVLAAVFFAVDFLAAVFFLGDRLAVALAFVVVAVFLAPAAFFFGDRLAVVLAAGFFFAVDFDAVCFFAAIYVAPLYRRLFSFQSFLSHRARKNVNRLRPPKWRRVPDLH